MRLAILLYLAALIVLIGFGLAEHFRPDPHSLEADEREYFDITSGIISGHWAISPRRTLGFPTLMAGMRLFGDSFVGLQISMTAFYALSVPALFTLVRRLSNASLPAVLAALFLMFWPTAVFYGTSLYSETAALPVFLASLTLLPAGSRVLGGGRPQLILASFSGLVLGVAAHIRPMYLLFLPVLFLILLLEERRTRVALLRFMAVLAGFLVVVLPWSIAVTGRFHEPILLSANGGETLAGGLTPRLLQPDGEYDIKVSGRTAWVGAGKWLPIEENGYLSRSELSLPYAKKDPLLKQRVMAWIEANKALAAELELSKLAYMWGIYPMMRNGLAQMLLGNLPILFLFAFCLVLLIRQPANWGRYARLWTLTLFVSGVALISWGSWRFRQPADAGLLAFAAIGLWSHLVPGVRGRPGDEPRGDRG